MSEIETKHYLANGTAARRARGARVGDRDARADGRPEVLRPARPLAAHDAAVDVVRRVRVRRGPRLRRLLDPRLAGDQRVGHAARCRRPTTAILDPFTEAPTLSLICEIRDPLTRRAVRQGPARSSRSAPRSTCARPASPTPRTSAPSASSSSSTRSRTSSGRTRRTTRSTRPRATGTPASPGLGYTIRAKEGYFPPAPHDTLHDLRTRDGADARAARHPVRVPPPRGRVRRPVRDRPALRDARRAWPTRS